MEGDEKYNGWTNRDTWLAHLWLTNDYYAYHATIKSMRSAPSVEARNLMMKITILELGNHDKIDFARVDWDAVAASFAEDLEGE